MLTTHVFPSHYCLVKPALPSLPFLHAASRRQGSGRCHQRQVGRYHQSRGLPAPHKRPTATPELPERSLHRAR